MTEPTEAPPGRAGVSSDDRPLRLEALRLAVATVDSAPYYRAETTQPPADRIDVATREGTAVLDLAKRYLTFLTGEAQ